MRMCNILVLTVQSPNNANPQNASNQPPLIHLVPKTTNYTGSIKYDQQHKWIHMGTHPARYINNHWASPPQPCPWGFFGINWVNYWPSSPIPVQSNLALSHNIFHFQ